MDRVSEIKKILDGSANRLRYNYFEKYHPDITQEIILFSERIIDLPFKWKVWHWMYDKPDYLLCKCGARLNSHISIWKGYRQWCSHKCASNDPELRTRARNTLVEKYGVSHYSKTDEYKEKVKQTSRIKYGVDNFSQTDMYREKSTKTYLDKWAVTNFTKTDEYKSKSKQTFRRKWGVDSYLQTKEGKDRMRIANIKRFGTDSIFKSESFRRDNYIMCNDENYICYIGEGINRFKCDYGYDHEYEISTDNYYGRKQNGNKLCTICNPISSSDSLKQNMVYEFISLIYQKSIICNYKDKYEIDVYLPDLNLGFEFNGIYWHSEKMKDKNYHADKTDYFSNKGIRIFHIWEDDWIYRNDIIKSQISNLLKVNQSKIFARKCIIKEIDTKQTKDFINKNHIQGWVVSTIKLGLFYEDELVSVMTFDQYEGRKKMNESEYNLNRFCNTLNTSVVGSASKLLNYFINKYKPCRLISYADRDWSMGDIYYKLGFQLISLIKPDYKYVINRRRVHKSRFRKKKLGYQMTESQFIQMKGISKVWNCGKLKFEMCF